MEVLLIDSQEMNDQANDPLIGTDTLGEDEIDGVFGEDEIDGVFGEDEVDGVLGEDEIDGVFGDVERSLSVLVESGEEGRVCSLETSLRIGAFYEASKDEYM